MGLKLPLVWNPHAQSTGSRGNASADLTNRDGKKMTVYRDASSPTVSEDMYDKWLEGECSLICSGVRWTPTHLSRWMSDGDILSTDSLDVDCGVARSQQTVADSGCVRRADCK